MFFASTRTDYASRMAVAVRAGHQVLGLIFVLADRPPLVENAEAVLSDAAGQPRFTCCAPAATTTRTGSAAATRCAGW